MSKITSSKQPFAVVSPEIGDFHQGFHVIKPFVRSEEDCFRNPCNFEAKFVPLESVE